MIQAICILLKMKVTLHVVQGSRRYMWSPKPSPGLGCLRVVGLASQLAQSLWEAHLRIKKKFFFCQYYTSSSKNDYFYSLSISLFIYPYTHSNKILIFSKKLIMTNLFFAIWIKLHCIALQKNSHWPWLLNLESQF